MSRILTVEQAAEKLQMTAKVVREYLRVGKLPVPAAMRCYASSIRHCRLWV